jgi:hypothetical protein
MSDCRQLTAASDRLGEHVVPNSVKFKGSFWLNSEKLCGQRRGDLLKHAK